MRVPTAAKDQMKLLYRQGLGATRIARRLTEMGYLNARGAAFTTGSVGASLVRLGLSDPTNRRAPGRCLPATLKMPEDPIDLAYLGGIFDGEGSVNWLSRKRPDGTFLLRHQVTVTNTDTRLIEWLAAIGGKVYPYATSKTPCFTWAVSRRADIVLFLTTLRPYIRLKHERLDRMLADIERVDHFTLGKEAQAAS